MRQLRSNKDLVLYYIASSKLSTYRQILSSVLGYQLFCFFHLAKYAFGIDSSVLLIFFYDIFLVFLNDYRFFCRLLFILCFCAKIGLWQNYFMIIRLWSKSA